MLRQLIREHLQDKIVEHLKRNLSKEEVVSCLYGDYLDLPDYENYGGDVDDHKSYDVIAKVNDVYVKNNQIIVVVVPLRPFTKKDKGILVYQFLEKNLKFYNIKEFYVIYMNFNNEIDEALKYGQIQAPIEINRRQWKDIF
jgi:hypothetical protein